MVFEKTWWSRVVKLETYGSFTCVTFLREFVELYKLSLSLFPYLYFMYMTVHVYVNRYIWRYVYNIFSIYTYMCFLVWLYINLWYVCAFIFTYECTFIYTYIMYIYRLAISVRNHWWAAKLSNFVNHRPVFFLLIGYFQNFNPIWWASLVEFFLMQRILHDAECLAFCGSNFYHSELQFHTKKLQGCHGWGKTKQFQKVLEQKACW